MSEVQPTHTWRMIGATVRGASHIREGLPNQDKLALWSSNGFKGPPLVIAVSDGHGSALRSDRGAQLAVDEAKRQLCALLSTADVKIEADPTWLRDHVADAIVKEWRLRVDEDYNAAPFSGEEMARFEKAHGAAALRSLETEPRRAYGATLLVVAITECVIIYLQLGDGDILEVLESGEVARPMPPDDRLIANETTSLCLPSATQDFRVAVRQADVKAPVLITASSDGYSNSFRDDEVFRKIGGTDLLQDLRREGLRTVERRLEDWLRQASTEGSGDDVTLAIIKRDEERDYELLVERVASLETRVSGFDGGIASLRRELLGIRRGIESVEDRLEASRRWLAHRVVLLSWSLGTVFAIAVASALAAVMSISSYANGYASSREVVRERAGAARAHQTMPTTNASPSLQREVIPARASSQKQPSAATVKPPVASGSLSDRATSGEEMEPSKGESHGTER